MNRSKLWVFAVTAVLIGLRSAASASPVDFVALPANVSGPAGSTVGWGYSITNNSTTQYLNFTAIDSDLFAAADGTPNASIFDFPLLAPGQTVTENYDPAAFLGLFQFTWNPDVPVGTTETGMFILYGALCDASDPFCASDLSVNSTALARTRYSATVAGSSSVPEPGTLLMIAGGAGALVRRSRQRRSGPDSLR